MCGFLGRFNVDLPLSDLREGLAMLSRRGPDASAIWNNNDFSFGHARLSIIDLSQDGTQPFHGEGNDIHCVVNGEIYDFGLLRKELQRFGHVFKSRGDSETLLHGYEEWGFEALLAKVNGMFAFAVYDENERQLVLARDRIGIKPLYYWRDGDAFAFASELPALLKLLPIQPAIDEFAFESYLSFGYVPGDLTIFENCRKLPAGHWLSFKSDRLTIQRYWAPPLPVENRQSESDVVETIHRQLRRSVERRLISDRPLGAFLSGGIDSSLVCGVAKEFVSDLRTFTIAFADRNCDESDQAQRIADHLGTRHTQMRCGEGEALDIVETIPDIYGEPFADPSAIPTLLLSKLTRQHVVVALSGDGGDELGLGYTRYQHSPLIERVLKIPGKSLAEKLSAVLLGIPGRIGKVAQFLSLKSRTEACLAFNGIFHPLYFSKLLDKRFPVEQTSWANLFQQSEYFPLSTAWSWVDLQHYLCDDILTKVDRASMSVALEVRVPLLDHELVESICSLPSNLSDSPSHPKKLFKRLLKNYVPENLWTKSKQGFSPPLGAWFRGPLRDILWDLLSPAKLRQEGRFNPDFVSKLLDEHAKEKRDNSVFLWTLLVWEMWRGTLRDC